MAPFQILGLDVPISDVLPPDPQVPDLEAPESNLQPSDLHHAQPGDPQGITAILTQKLQAEGMTVQSDRKGDRLGILVEASLLPDRDRLTNWCRQEVTRLNPSGVRRVEIYGRQRGERIPGWREVFELDLESAPDSIAEVDIFRLSDWLRQGRSEKSAAFLPPPVSPTPSAQFLRFYLSSTETALLPIDSIKEVLQIPTTAVLPVPQMAASILGAYNRRGNILWLVDLGLQLGISHVSVARTSILQPQPRQVIATSRRNMAAAPSLNMILIQVEQEALGLVVPRVLDIETHSLSDLQPPVTTLFPPQLSPFIQAYLPRSTSPILNLLPLLNEPSLQLHRHSKERGFN
jgi:positive phototaxis protein PixI